MMYDLSEQEIQHIEKYRDLTEEFQTTLDEQADILFRTQTRIFKEMITGKAE